MSGRACALDDELAFELKVDVIGGERALGFLNVLRYIEGRRGDGRHRVLDGLFGDCGFLLTGSLRVRAALRHRLGDEERIHRVCLINRIGFERVGGDARLVIVLLWWVDFGSQKIMGEEGWRGKRGEDQRDWLFCSVVLLFLVKLEYYLDSHFGLRT